ncbi:MAG: HAD family hydrolase [archaeon]
MKKVLFLDFSETLYSVSGVFSDTMSFLDKVKDEYVLVIIADEDTKELEEKMNSFGITKYFALVFSPKDYGMKKPDHKLVNVALALVKDKTGEDVSKNDCFLLGDRPDKDIKMGNMAGIRTIRVKRGAYAYLEPEYDEEKANYTVQTLKDALEILLPKVKSEKKAVRKKIMKVKKKR